MHNVPRRSNRHIDWPGEPLSLIHISAAAYKASIGEPLVYPRYDLKYAENFLHMMFSVPYRQYEATPEVAAALNLFLICLLYTSRCV